MHSALLNVSKVLTPDSPQGVGTDYAMHCCRQAGYETIMLNSNPETVSTDYDTSSRLYFEPLTVEDVLEVIAKERPEGIIVQFGGQTPLNLAAGLDKALKENPLPAASGKSRPHPCCIKSIRPCVNSFRRFMIWRSTGLSGRTLPVYFLFCADNSR